MHSREASENRPGQGPYAGPGLYEVTVRGGLNRTWSQWFGGLKITHRDRVTTLTGPVTDQAALRGILCRIWDLNLIIVSVRLVGEKTKTSRRHTVKGGAARETDNFRRLGATDSVMQKQEGGRK